MSTKEKVIATIAALCLGMALHLYGRDVRAAREARAECFSMESQLAHCELHGNCSPSPLMVEKFGSKCPARPYGFHQRDGAATISSPVKPK